MRGVFEMVMFQVGKGMHHVRVSAGDFLRPERLSGAFHAGRSLHVLEGSADDQFRAERAGAQFGGREVEVVAGFHLMIGKLVALREADAPGIALRHQ